MNDKKEDTTKEMEEILKDLENEGLSHYLEVK